MRGLIAVLVLAAAASQVAALEDPSAAGAFPVGVTTLTLVDASRGGRTLPTEVWYPATSTERDAPLRRGRRPLVLVAHGFCGFRTNYEYLAAAIASHGFVVAAPDFPNFTRSACDGGTAGGDAVNDPPRDLSFLRTVLHDRSGPAARIARAVGGKRAALVGHSLGGLVVSNASIRDDAFTAVIGLAPLMPAASAGTLNALRPRRAVMVVVGTADTTVPISFTQPFFDGLAPPAFEVTVIGGTHSGFTDMDSRLTPAALARQQALTERYVIAFLERYLGRRRGFQRFLTPADAAAQGADVTLTARVAP